MKLKNKLLPLVGVATLAAAIAPATSCVEKKVEVTMHSALEGFTPTYGKAGYLTGMSEKAVEDLYIEHIKENPDILAEDLAWWESNLIEYRLKNCQDDARENFYNDQNLEVVGDDYIYTVPKIANFGVSVPTFKDFKITNPYTGAEETIHTVSMQLDYEFEYSVTALCKNAENNRVATATQTINTKFSSIYKDIPFAVKYNTEYSTYAIETTGFLYNQLWTLNKIPGWQFDFSSTTTRNDYTRYNDGQIYECSDELVETNTINTTAKLKQALGDLINKSGVYAGAVNQYCFNFGSYHLLNVQPPEISFNQLGYSAEEYTKVNTDYTQWGGTEGDVRVDFWGANYNYSYRQMFNQIHLDTTSDDSTITLELDEDLKLPIYKYWNNDYVYDKDDKEIMYLTIAKNQVLWNSAEDFRELVHDQAGSGYANFGIRATCDWSNSKEWCYNDQHLPFNFRNYYAYIPTGTTFKIGLKFMNESTHTRSEKKTLSFKLKAPIVLTWDEFSFLDFKE